MAEPLCPGSGHHQLGRERSRGCCYTGTIGRGHHSLGSRSHKLLDLYDGPVGADLARLEGTGQGSARLVTLDVPGEEPLTATSAEALLYHQTGWILPFSSLDYWMRGIPAPGTDFVRVLNNEGYLAELEQNGWHVAYGSYKAVGSMRLPSRIKATRDGVRVILSIREWTLH